MRYIIKRFSTYVLTLFIAMAINFFIPRLIPGNPIQARLHELLLLGVEYGGDEFVKEYSKIFALDQPLHIQFIIYLGGLLQGNMGFSINYFPTPVSKVIMAALPWTIGLLFSTLMMGFAGGLLLGALMGWKKRKGKGSQIGFFLLVILSRIPYYVLGIMLIYLLAYTVPVFPIGGSVDRRLTPGTIEYVISVLRYSALPALSLLIIQVGGRSLASRALMVSVLGEDYLFLAKAKGLKERDIFMNYAMKNTLLPLITDLAISIGFVAAGSMLVEIVFSYPGIGSVLYSAVHYLDYPLIQGIVIIIIFTVTTAVFLIELIYPLIDPRIHEK